jgi:hypothetical protein
MIEKKICFTVILFGGLAFGTACSSSDSSAGDGSDPGTTEQASSTGCHGDECIYVNGKGDYVNYVVGTFHNGYATTRCGRQHVWDSFGHLNEEGPSHCVSPGNKLAETLGVNNTLPEYDLVCTRFTGDPAQDTPCVRVCLNPPCSAW